VSKFLNRCHSKVNTSTVDSNSLMVVVFLLFWCFSNCLFNPLISSFVDLSCRLRLLIKEVFKIIFGCFGRIMLLLELMVCSTSLSRLSISLSRNKTLVFSLIFSFLSLWLSSFSSVLSSIRLLLSFIKPRGREIDRFRKTGLLSMLDSRGLFLRFPN
jgi:hypothetical protein